MRLRTLLALLAPAAVGAQPPAAPPAPVSYVRAEQLLPWHAANRVTGDAVNPQWYRDGTRFWYRNKTKQGAEFVTVDPARNTRALLFDNARLAAAMSLAADTSFDPGRLPFQSFRFADDNRDERAIEFSANRKRWTCVLATYACTMRDSTPSETPYVLSPDRTREAYVYRHNVWVRKRGGGDSVQLTTDGVEDFSYGLPSARPMQVFRPSPRRPSIRWSPDGTKLAVGRTDERRVARMPYISYTSQRPRMFTQPYALPGDSIVPHPFLHVIDVATKQNVVVQVDPRPNQLQFTGSAVDSLWSPSSDKLYVSWYTRGSKSAYLGEADARTGAMRVLARDTGKTYVEIGSPRDPVSWYVTRDGKETIWWSERDGWSHLWLMGADGKAAQITRGAWNVAAVQHVDEATRTIWFTARGREPGRHPYYAHLYRVRFDGTGLELLTPEDADHQISFAPGGRFFVDTRSRVETPPVTTLRTADGRVLRTLETADVTALAEIGWRAAQPFTVRARDGVTELHGILYLPPDLDPKKKYPIIDHIYPGPQVGSVGAWSFKGSGEPFALAQLGFVVMQLDHMGTPLRSKAFHDAYYGNFGDNGLPDHMHALRQLATRHGFIDLDRVGIFGHSGGGFASTDAILRYPEFWKVAVSGAGNHDNRSYNIYWAEKYQGLMKRDTLRRTDNFAASANASMAPSLKGRLMLMHGDMDDNVHPAMTVQVIDALTRANRSFDLVWAPNRAHSLNEPYFIRRRWDYFVEHLLGAAPPDNYEMMRPSGGGGGMGDDTPGEELDDPWAPEPMEAITAWLRGRG